jgi:hypothetical protein
VYPVAFPDNEAAYLQLALKLNDGEAGAPAGPAVRDEIESDPVAG